MMRRAFSGQKLLSYEDRFIGVELGSDFTSEHERGITGIRTLFDIDIKTAQIRKCYEQDVRILEDGKNIALIAEELRPWMVGREEKLPSELSYRGKELECAWDSDSFGILVRKKEHEQDIRDLRQAFLDKDIIIGFPKKTKGEYNPFANSPLSLMILSRCWT